MGGYVKKEYVEGHPAVLRPVEAHTCTLRTELILSMPNAMNLISSEEQ